MSRAIDESHDPALKSWVESANRPGTDFPIQNLPLGVVRRRIAGESPRIGVAIGDSVLDLRRCDELGMLQELPQDVREATKRSQLNGLFGLGAAALSGLRRQVMRILKSDSQRAYTTAVVPIDDV